MVVYGYVSVCVRVRECMQCIPIPMQPSTLRMPKQNKKETHAALVCEALPASTTEALCVCMRLCVKVCVSVAASFFVAVAQRDRRLTD